MFHQTNKNTDSLRVLNRNDNPEHVLSTNNNTANLEQEIIIQYLVNLEYEIIIQHQEHV